MLVVAALASIVIGCEHESPSSSEPPTLVAEPLVDDTPKTSDEKLAGKTSEQPPDEIDTLPQEIPVDRSDGMPVSHALLIGCNKYDYLPGASLQGPANDTVLMRRLLVDRFNFKTENIRILSDNVGGQSSRPLRANIEREFKRLARRVAKGDQVTVLLSGHGSQQPDDDPQNPQDPEPDGLDEVFLPADTKPGIDLKTLSIPNAIRDDEIGLWLKAIQKQGASIWVVVDACHSGSGIRGTETPRQILPGQLIAKELLDKAKTTANTTRGSRKENSTLDVADESGGLVAIYAAQPH